MATLEGERRYCGDGNSSDSAQRPESLFLHLTQEQEKKVLELLSILIPEEITDTINTQQMYFDLRKIATGNYGVDYEFEFKESKIFILYEQRKAPLFNINELKYIISLSLRYYKQKDNVERILRTLFNEEEVAKIIEALNTLFIFYPPTNTNT